MAKKKPCEYCEDASWFSLDGRNGHQLYVEIYPDENYIGVTSYGADENGDADELSTTVPMHYCPNCGRKLEW